MIPPIRIGELCGELGVYELGAHISFHRLPLPLASFRWRRRIPFLVVTRAHHDTARSAPRTTTAACAIARRDRRVALFRCRRPGARDRMDAEESRRDRNPAQGRGRAQPNELGILGEYA